MSDTPGRMLGLLSLLEGRSSWSGGELAERLEVTTRTVRRDVDRLRALGYPVEASPGVAGGYQLGRGGKMPPLLLGDEEAMAVALGLRMATDGSVTGLEDAATAVLGRLDQMLPQAMASRVRALHQSTAQLVRPDAEQVASADLVALGQACSRSERVRFDYADRRGQPSRRLVEPYRLVRVEARWYLVARDVHRRDWRTFRVDRLAHLETLGTGFELVDPPDAVAMVSKGLRVRAYPFTARLRFEAGLDEVARLLPATIGTLEASGTDATVVDVGGASLPRMVRFVASMALPATVIDPPELRAALVDHLRALLAANP